MKKKTSHIMTSGEILSKKKNKTIGILSVVLFISVIFNIYLFTDISILGLDEHIPGKFIAKGKVDNIVYENRDVDSTSSVVPQDEVSQKVTAADIDKFDRSSIEAFERESGIQLIYTKSPLEQKVNWESDGVEGELIFGDIDNPCKSFSFSDNGCYANFSDGSQCSFNLEKVNEFKEIMSKVQLYYYYADPYYETDGGKVVQVKIDSFRLELMNKDHYIAYSNFYLPANYDELKEYFEKLHQICISE